MSMIDLSAQEIEILIKSIENCLRTCQQGGVSGGCPDCESLKKVLTKLEAGR